MMGNAAGAFEKRASQTKVDKASLILTQEENFMKLLKKYREDIAEIESMMQSLRAEREEFYLHKLPAIRKELEMDEVSEDVRAEWLNSVQQNIEKSFRISESLISHYVTKNLDEFKEQLQEALDRI